MKKQQGHVEKKITKGSPSGVMISLALHAGAFFLAGMLVVFTVVKKEEKTFEPPPPVERPKMKLKKPKVKVRKSAKPRSASRIVTKIKRAEMPDIQLPEASGIGDGFSGGGGFGGFELNPDLSEVSVFGAAQSIGNDFEGTFYDFKRDRKGGATIMDNNTFIDRVSEFVRSGWKTSKLAPYYRSPDKLYATSFMIPTVPSSLGPFAFGEKETIGWCWMAHYKGELVYPEDITFRFWGQGDDVLVVRVDGKIVLNGSWPDGSYAVQEFLTPMWQSNAAGTRSHRLGNNMAEGGDWITLKAGESLPMEVILGEAPGGHFDAMLCVEVKGVDYPMNNSGGPIFPMFTSSNPTHELLDSIIPLLVPGEASLTTGPVFRDY